MRDLAKVTKERDTFERIAREQEHRANSLGGDLAALKGSVGRGSQADYHLEMIERNARDLRALGLGK